MSDRDKESLEPSHPGPDEESAGRVQSTERQPAAIVSAVGYFAGPIPPPQVLMGYDDVLPGLAGRIVTMAVDEALHRREREARNSKLEIRGQVFGFVIAIFSFAVAALLISMDRPFHGIAAVVGAVAGLSGLFVWSRSVPKKATPAPPDGSGREFPSGTG